ncbi:hypothetical protein COL00_26620 [Bacillus cereus]|uniref:hypothetical protein n=1 Tax=Bacillus cereus TaxID=1396 RepID=UPI000BF817D8|nr:hypothetical protein [Bacillus cereus]PFV39821.1 hypothetical protein COL00_26620 [Bacillus cereus]
MDYEKVIYAVVGAIAGAFLNQIFTWSRERRGRKRNNKEKILKEVYAPIYQILSQDKSYFSDYKGPGKLGEIEKIIHSNSELVDSRLREIIEDTKAGGCFMDVTIGNYSGPKAAYDFEELFCYVYSKYNSLRKKLGLPYDK